MRTTVVIAKSPVPGMVKTRLCPPLTPAQACEVAAAALADTLDVVAELAGRKVIALDGEPCEWFPDCFDVVDQGSGTLNDRLGHVMSRIDGPVVVVAMDTPQVTGVAIERAHAQLECHHVVLGPTDDGGYWLIGADRHHPELFANVTMSRASTCAEQIRQAERLGLRTALAESLRDVDTFADCLAVSELVPDGRFGRVVRGL
jgi:hypothetical protein